MQKKTALLLISSLLYAVYPLTAGPNGADSNTTADGQAEKSSLAWTSQYAEAAARAKQSNKPLFLYFTGSDWCGWCKAMDKEILSSPDFVKLVGDKFIFVDIDFPIYKAQDQQTKQQNDELKEKFDIRGYPTVIILNPEGKQIAILNYKSGGGKSYAEYLLKLLKEQEQFQQGMKSLQTKDLASLQKLYDKASQLGMDNDAKAIIAAALDKEDSSFFLTERYRQFANDGELGSSEAQKVRKKLLSSDPDNKKGVHYSVAIIDFEANAEKLADQPNADIAIKPLKEYLQKFGGQDSENRWRIEMTISQVLRSKNQTSEALAFAQSSLEHAPDTYKSSVAQAVIGLEQNTSNIGSAETSGSAEIPEEK